MKRGRPKSKGGIRIDLGDDALSDPEINAAAIALIRLIAKRASVSEPSAAKPS